jgi:DNA-binding transcriptional regulator LsrR (DeoR family)
MKPIIRLKHFTNFFNYMINYDTGVSVKQLCNELNIGRNVVIRVLKQAEKEEMITRIKIDETNIELITLTDKAKKWIL